MNPEDILKMARESIKKSPKMILTNGFMPTDMCLLGYN